MSGERERVTVTLNLEDAEELVQHLFDSELPPGTLPDGCPITPGAHTAHLVLTLAVARAYGHTERADTFAALLAKYEGLLTEAPELRNIRRCG